MYLGLSSHSLGFRVLGYRVSGACPMLRFWLFLGFTTKNWRLPSGQARYWCGPTWNDFFPQKTDTDSASLDANPSLFAELPLEKSKPTGLRVHHGSDSETVKL